MTPRRSGRASGFTVAEVLVATLLGLLLLQMGMATLARYRTVQRALTVRSELLVAQRTARHLLRMETGRGIPGRDWSVGSDSVGIRAFRGTAWVCPMAAPSRALLVRYAGERIPDPTKDSVLLFRPDGTHSVHDLVRLGGGGGVCPETEGGARGSSWELDPEVPPGAVLARLFERGSYHLADSALRYRRGGSGRQPLTPPVWRTPGSRIVHEDGFIRLELDPLGSVGGAGWGGRVGPAAWP